jgi:hypothetical protein
MLQLLYIACQGSSQITGETSTLDAVIDVDLWESEIVLEHLSDARSAAAGTAYQSFHSDGEAYWMLDESTGEGSILGAGEVFDAAVFDGDLIVALDGLIYSYGEGIEEESLNSLLPTTIEKFETSGDVLWMLGSGQLYRYVSALLSRINFEGAHHISDFVVSSEGTVWMGAPWLLSYDSAAGEVSSVDAAVMVEGLCIDSSDTLWVLHSDSLRAIRSDGRQADFDLGDSITEVRANPMQSDVWLKSQAGAFHHSGGVFSLVDLPDGDWQDVDARGRLLISTGEGIVRASVGRPVVTVGLDWNEELLAQRELRLLPSDSASVLSLEAWIGDQPLEVDPILWTTKIDPADYAPGQRFLRFLSTGESGSYIDEHPLVIGDLPDVSWDGEIALLSEEQCSLCHSGATATRLESKSEWEWNIDAIINEVSRNSMPLGGPYLSEDEIALIRGWQAGGFQ